MPVFGHHTRQYSIKHIAIGFMENMLYTMDTNDFFPLPEFAQFLHGLSQNVKK